MERGERGGEVNKKDSEGKGSEERRNRVKIEMKVGGR